jgi:hypothetical protein
MKISKFFLASFFAIFLVIAILFGAFLTLGGIEMFFDELKLINENLATGFAMSLLGTFIVIVACFIFKKFLLED